MPTTPRHRALAFALLAGAACASSPAATPAGSPASRVSGWTPALADSLVRVGREDQQGRDALPKALAAQDTVVILASMRADSAHSRWLRALVASHGWPTRAAVGDGAAGAAWLVLQHSPFNDWQEAMLPTLERLAAQGELPRPDVALLTDRVLVHRGQPQRYGSQFDAKDGRLVPSPIADLPGLDARRAAVGLPPMAEYVKMLGEFYKMPVVWPPER